jgi:hypothetical protein
MRVVIERVVLTLLHPQMIMASISVLALHTAAVTFLYQPPTVRYPYELAAIGFTAGAFGFLAITTGHRAVVAFAGALLSVTALIRGMAVLHVALDSNELSEVQAAALVGAGQWFTIAYVTWYVWRRMVTPWAVVRRQT